MKAGADKAGAELGVEVSFEGPDNETRGDRQIDMLAAALAKEPAAIGFAALEGQAAIPPLKQAQEAKIPVPVGGCRRGPHGMLAKAGEVAGSAATERVQSA